MINSKAGQVNRVSSLCREVKSVIGDKSVYVEINYQLNISLYFRQTDLCFYKTHRKPFVPSKRFRLSVKGYWRMGLREFAKLPVLFESSNRTMATLTKFFEVDFVTRQRWIVDFFVTRQSPRSPQPQHTQIIMQGGRIFCASK